jgi:hypothetical protein
MLAVAAVLASFTHYFGFLLAAAAFCTCVLVSDGRRRVMAFVAGTGVLISFAPWVLHHADLIDAERATWIGSFR